MENKIKQRICVDSRLVCPGDFFFALPGARVDGHTFLEDVAKKGAAAAYVLKEYADKDVGIPLIAVDDVLEELQRLAKEKAARFKGKIVAITGSVGKTSCKEFLKTLLSEKYRVSATPGNQNSQIGLPLSILNDFTGDEDVWVVEMGMTKPGQITRLTQITPPDIAVITMVTLVHAENFDSLQGIALAKGEILTHPKTKVGILNEEIEHLQDLLPLGTCQKVIFSPSAQFPALPIVGKHHLTNFVAAATAARELGLNSVEIETGAAKIQLPERRMEIVKKRGVTFINDSYNACALSIKAALENMPEPKVGRKKIAVLAEMPELGKFSEECHREVGQFALDRVDRMLCLGDPCRPIVNEWKSRSRPVDLFFDKEQLVALLKQEMEEGDVVLIKGANSKQMWKVLELIE